MRLSLIVCTRNRAADLRAFLAGARGWLDPGVPWETVVVDNGSADDTPRLLQESAASFPGALRVLREEEPGLARARNAGLRAARGDLVVFTDDDVRPAAGWLRAVVEVAGRRDHLAFGGRVLPLWDRPAPAWLTARGPFRILGGPVLAYDHGDAERDCDEAMYVPTGACMFFRAEAFRRHGGFREDLGRKGAGLLSADDAELFFRLRGAGHPILYAPSVVVQHPVDPARLTRAYHRRWYWHLGRSNARMRGHQPGARRLLGFPGYALREVRRAGAGLARALLLGPPEARFFHELRLRAALAQALELRRLAAAGGEC